MNKLFALLLPLCPLFMATPSMAQGCSDAGMCSLSAFQQAGPDTAAHPNTLRMGAAFGLADYNIVVLNSQIEYSRKWNSRFSTDLRLSHLSHFENYFGPVHGLGDLFLLGNFEATNRLRTSLGMKIPLTDGDRRNQSGRAMPMDLQSSLGTYDLIAGIGYRVWKLDLFLAWQQPLTQNGNSYFHPCPIFPDDLCFSNPPYPSTNGFRRAGDLMLRMALPWQTSARWTFTPGLLGIYHLANDSYLDRDGIRHDFEGSQGLTLNVNLFVDYALKSRGSIGLQLGAPAVVRESRPDGLTRALVAGLQYRHLF